MSRICASLVAIALTLVPMPIAWCADSKAPVAVDRSTKPEASGEDWPAFLGPHGTGVTTDTGIADHWPEEGPPVVWSKRLQEGFAAPSVRAGKLVIFQGERSKEIVECVRADNGEPIWKFEYGGVAATPYYGDGPRATPLLTANRCYTLGLGGKLICLDFQTGKQIWAHDLTTDFELASLPFGFGATPILEDDLLIVPVGGRPNSAVVAFRAETGDIVWQSVGKDTWDGIETPRRRQQPTYKWKGGEDLISYSSPIGATIHGKRQVLCLTRQGLVSLNPQNGQLNFKYWFSSTKQASVVAARPLVIDDRIFLTASYAVGCTLLELDPSCRNAKEVWFGRALQSHWSTPIYIDGYIYGFTGREEPQGRLACLDVKTGQAAWFERGYDEHRHDLILDQATQTVKNKTTGETVPYPFFGRGSLTLAGKRLIILGEHGTLALAEPSPKGYHEVCRTSVPGIRFPVWPSPVLAGKKLYLRDMRHVVCVDLAPQP